MLKKYPLTAKCLAIVLLILTFCVIDVNAALVTWQIDGKAIDDDDFHVEAGVLHTVTAKLSDPHKKVVVILRKTLPDGRMEVFEKKLDDDSPTAEFPLGPLTSPAIYEYEAGVTYCKGYRLELAATEPGSNHKQQSLRYYQTQCTRLGLERFAHGDITRSVSYGGIKERKSYLRDKIASMFPPLALKLNPSVLADQDKLTVEYAARLKPPGSIECVLVVSGPAGEEVLRRELTAKTGSGQKLWQRSPGWQKLALNPASWKPGAYRIEMWPKLGGKLWKEGPSIVYHRREKNPAELLISPYALWRLQRDTSRRELCLSGKEITQPGIVQPKLEGMYAVFARARDNCFMRVGSQGLVRLVIMPQAPGSEYTFVAARDLSGEGVEIFEEKNSPSRLESLLFVPVTKKSVEKFYTETGSPPMPLFGVNDWCCYFFGPVRYNADQFETLLGSQAELGLRTIDWSIGRSWIEYHTDLENTTRYPCVPLEEAVNKFPKAATNYEGRIRMINDFRPLQSVFAAREKFGVRIWPWLSMQRHYGTYAYGGLFASEFYRNHLDMCRCPKNTNKPRQGELCYWFEEVRQERVAILLDVAEKGADGLLVGCCRQVPMLLYHPKMTAAYEAETGINPRKIDASSPKEYRRWITWRAEFFTKVLRDLKKGLAKIEKEQNRRIPLAVRIPSAGLDFNLAQGLDVEKWCKEGLVDSLQVEPLDVRIYPEGSHDIGPYLELRKRYGISVLGGVGATWDFNPEGIIPALKRARGLIEAKVDGIEIYETEWQARSTQTRWIVPLMGNLRQIDVLLNESNMEACYPVHSTNATYGHDNHSFGNGGWSTYGSGMRSL